MLRTAPKRGLSPDRHPQGHPRQRRSPATPSCASCRGGTPTSLSARPASFRPEIELLGETTRVLVEQVGAIDAGHLGDLIGRVTPDQQWGIDEALTTVLGLR
jgi:mRNA-degrading endonuclease toxin of MazEF toxin-antitoxin module